jgi:hypothetical protein
MFWGESLFFVFLLGDVILFKDVGFTSKEMLYQTWQGKQILQKRVRVYFGKENAGIHIILNMLWCQKNRHVKGVLNIWVLVFVVIYNFVDLVDTIWMFQ